MPEAVITKSKGSYRNCTRANITTKPNVRDEHFHRDLRKEACYSGKEINAAELMEKGRDYAPGIDDYTFSSTPPVVPGENGEYPVLPGVYRPFA